MSGANYFFYPCCLTNKCYRTGRCRGEPNFMGCRTNLLPGAATTLDGFLESIDGLVVGPLRY
jgi:hypothetical protein